MCKVWKIYIHIIHGVNTGKIGNAHRLYTAKPKVIHKVIHRLWIKKGILAGGCGKSPFSRPSLWITRGKSGTPVDNSVHNVYNHG